MAPKKKTARAKSDDSKNTLYCSFCGKSQHEVKKLIAGPTVFICDECTELCQDIVFEETYKKDGKLTISIRSSPMLEPSLELALVSAYSDIIRRNFPGAKADIHSYHKSADSVRFEVIVDSNEITEEGGLGKYALEERIEQLNFQLAKAKSIIAHNNKESERLRARVAKLNEVVADVVLDALSRTNETEEKFLLVANLDIVGFSAFDDAARNRIIEIFRMHMTNLTRARGAIYHNTAGDSFICCFESVSAGATATLLVMVFLELEGIKARAALTYGPVSIGYNEVIARSDILGDTVNLSNRLLMIAQQGEVLAVPTIRHELEETRDIHFLRTHRVLKKGAGAFSAGETIECLALGLKRNSPILIAPDERPKPT